MANAIGLETYLSGERLPEIGCSRDQAGVITDQSDQKIDYYAKRVNQKRLAPEAIRKWGENSGRT